METDDVYYLCNLDPNLIIGQHKVQDLKDISDDASLLTIQNRFDEALQKYNYITNVYPFMDILVRKVGLLYIMGKYNETLQVYNQILEIDPTNVIAHAERGYLLDEMGRFDEALQDYNYAIIYLTHYHRIRRANLLTKMGRLNEALQDYNYIIDKVFDEKALEGRAYVYSLMGRFTDAIADYNDILDTFPNNTYIRQRRNYLMAR